MMFSTKGRYALRVMIDLAEQEQGKYTAMKDVAQRQGLSLKYLERILPAFVKEGMVEAVHGKGGGYKLTRAPGDYKISEILRIADGDLAPVACLECEATPCERVGECRTLPMWTELNRRINEYLDSITLADLKR